jgi:hypothetical protein
VWQEPQFVWKRRRASSSEEATFSGEELSEPS